MFTGRIGYAANNALFYVKGGAAVAKNEPGPHGTT